MHLYSKTISTLNAMQKCTNKIMHYKNGYLVFHLLTIQYTLNIFHSLGSTDSHHSRAGWVF